LGELAKQNKRKRYLGFSDYLEGLVRAKKHLQGRLNVKREKFQGLTSVGQLPN